MQSWNLYYIRFYVKLSAILFQTCNWQLLQLLEESGWLIVGALDSGWSGQASIPGQGLCIVFLVNYHIEMAHGIVTGDKIASRLFLCPL